MNWRLGMEKRNKPAQVQVSENVVKAVELLPGRLIGLGTVPLLGILRTENEGFGFKGG